MDTYRQAMISRMERASCKLVSPVIHHPKFCAQKVLLRLCSMRLNGKDGDMWTAGRAKSLVGLHIYVGPVKGDSLYLCKLNNTEGRWCGSNVPKILKKVIARRIDQSIVVKQAIRNGPLKNSAVVVT